MRKISAPILCLSGVLLASALHAQPLSRIPSRATIMKLDRPALDFIFSDELVSKTATSRPQRRGRRALARPLKLTLYVPAVGLVYLNFYTQHAKDWPAFIETTDGSLEPDLGRAVFLQGRARVKRRGSPLNLRQKRWHKIPVAGSLIELPSGRFELGLTFHLKKSRAVRFFQISTALDKRRNVPRSAYAASAPHYALASKTCAEQLPASMLHYEAESSPLGDGSLIQPLVLGASSYRVIDFATDCDYECTIQLGSGSQSLANSRIAAYVNSLSTNYSLNAIYRPQLGLTFSLVEQIARSSYTAYPQTLTNIEQLLYRFQQVQTKCNSRQADLCHLITGKNTWYWQNGVPNDLVIGLGFLGTICQTPTPSESLALSEYLGHTLTPVIMAHEIGHNLGAEHDEIYGGLMGPYLYNPPATNLTTKSRNEILATLNQVGYACLAWSGQSSSSTSSASSSSPPPGGGSGGVAPIDPTALLNVGYRSRVFNAAASIPANFGGGCQIDLMGASSRLRIENRPTYLGSAQIAAGEVQAYFSALAVPPTRLSRTGAKIRAFFTAHITCQTGGSVRSVVKGVRISARRGKVRGVKAWLRKVSAGL